MWGSTPTFTFLVGNLPSSTLRTFWGRTSKKNNPVHVAGLYPCILNSFKFFQCENDNIPNKFLCDFSLSQWIRFLAPTSSKSQPDSTLAIFSKVRAEVRTWMTLFQHRSILPDYALVHKLSILFGWSCFHTYCTLFTWTTVVDQLGFVLASLWWRYSLRKKQHRVMFFSLFILKRVSPSFNLSVDIAKDLQKSRNGWCTLSKPGTSLQSCWKADLDSCLLGLETHVNLVELVQVGIVWPVEPLQALHGHRDLHECGEVANVEILDAADLSLGKNDLGSWQLSLQVFQGIKVLPCLK